MASKHRRELEVYLYHKIPRARGGWVVSTMPRPLYPQERHPEPVYRRLMTGRGRSGWVRTISFPPGFETLDCPSDSGSL